MSTVLVTGASGFIGRHLLHQLERNGIGAVAAARHELIPDTDWREALEGIECVVHLAAMAHESAQRYERTGDYETLRRVNALATESLALSAARSGARRFVFVSTIGVCGDETLRVSLTEETPVAPRSLYATSKLEAERLLAAVSANTGLRLIVFRPTLVYGPGNGGNMLRLLRLIDSGWPLPFGSIDNRRSLTHIDNLVSAINAALTHSQADGTFVVCDEFPVSTPEIIRRLAEGMGRPAHLFPFPSTGLRLGATLFRHDALRRLIGSLEADCGKLSHTLGWRPPVSPEDGLRETGRWFRSSNAHSPSD